MSREVQPLPVGRLVALLREVVESNFQSVLVRGEVANLSMPASGHWYFTLKDAQAQIQGVMFRPQNRLLRFRPEDGMELIAGGRVSIYPQRGGLQLVCDTLEPAGLGSLQLALEQLRRRLAAEGLFDEGRKRPLPAYPRTIGVVTSATGAALHDILTVLRRRGAGVRVLLRPSLVQGPGAAEDVARGIEALNRQGEAEVLLVGRGGGSLEDLWAFNEERVVRAIAASRIPVISAVGHEVDVTLADLAADLRAPTPSAAAELVVRHRLELEGHLDHLGLRLSGSLQRRLERCRERFDGLRRRLASPAQRLALARLQWQRASERLCRAGGDLAPVRGAALAELAGRLQALSPLAVLGRGYAVVEHRDQVVRDAAALRPGDALRLRLHRGEAQARVTRVSPCDS